MPNIEGGIKRVERKARIQDLWDSVGRMLKISLRLAGLKLVRNEEEFIFLTNELSKAMNSESRKALTIVEEIDKLVEKEESHDNPKGNNAA